MPTSSGRPDRLRTYRTDVSGAADALVGPTSSLRSALDAFRASDGWADWVGDVPPLDVDLATARIRLARLAGFVGDVGDAFAAADDGEVVTADDVGLEALGAERLEDPGGGQGLVFDGERWILDAGVSGGGDGVHVQVYERDGQLFARVGELQPDGTILYADEIALTEEQAANLTIRTTDDHDYISLPPDATVRITVWARDGDDLVGGGGDASDDSSGENPGVGVGGGGSDTIFGGDGDDILLGGAGHDTIYGGDGSDSIDGQDGYDTLFGGDDFDVVYGGRDGDLLHGGEGDDYLEGGSGEDLLDGSAGNDTLSGGRGDDVLDGGEGHDHLLGGRGTDVVAGGGGFDTATGEDGDIDLDVDRKITIELTGDPGSYAVITPQPDWMTDAEYEAWLERIDSDLELLRTTPSGREGLAALDEASHDSDSRWNPFDSDRRVIVVPYGDADRVAWIDTDGDRHKDRAYEVADWLSGRGLPGNYASPPGGADGHHATVSAGGLHNHALDDRPPVASMYHELAHSYDQISGGTPSGDYTEILVDEDGNEVRRGTAPRAELNSVGMDLDGDGDIDTYPSRGGRDHPVALTENALRDDIGVDPRPSYTIVPGDDETVEFEDYDR